MLELVVYILATIFMIETVGYSLIVAAFSGWEKTYKLSKFPKVSIVIPAYNEEKFIEKKIKNILSLDYPRDNLEIIVVNDHSDDDTAEIVDRLSRKIRNLRLISHKTRKGQAAAFNTGVRNAGNHFILLSDADSLLDRNSLKHAVGSFDRDIGIVCGRVREVLNQSFVGKLNSLSWFYRGLYQSAESKIDSTLPVFTPFALVRKDVWQDLNEKEIANDLDLALKIRNKGYRVIVNPNCTLKLFNPSEFSKIRKQRTRQMFGGMRILMKNKHFLFNPKYGAFGFVVFPRFFYQNVIKQFLAILLGLGIVILAFSNVAFAISTALVLFLSIYFSNFILGLTLVMKFGERIEYLFLSTLRIFYTIIMAFVNVFGVLNKSSVKWEKA